MTSSAHAQTPDTTAAPPPPEYRSTVHARPKRDDGTPQIVLTAQASSRSAAPSRSPTRWRSSPSSRCARAAWACALDVRGAKQFSLLVLIDGVPVDEPYFGIFDVGAIPITDIVEIRVQLAPASPLEGPGGDGGIVEVTTLRAIGSRMIDGRVVGGSTPGGEASRSGRIGAAARARHSRLGVGALRRSDLPRGGDDGDRPAASTIASRK